MKAVREWSQFLWDWYVVRAWKYYFPPKRDDDAPSAD